MSDPQVSLLSGFTADLGLGTTVSAAVAGLWAGGWWNWIPALLVLCIGVYTLVLQRQLPWHGVLYKSLEQLSDGKNSHPSLQRKISNLLGGMVWSARQQVGSHSQMAEPSSAGNWLKTMTYANQSLDRWFGLHIWSYPAFKRLLMVAMLYPFLLILTMWCATGVGPLGATEVLAPLGTGVSGLAWRAGTLALTLWPFWWLWSFGQWFKNRLTELDPFWLYFSFWIVAGAIPIGFVPAILLWLEGFHSVPAGISTVSFTLAIGIACTGSVAGSFAASHHNGGGMPTAGFGVAAALGMLAALVLVDAADRQSMALIVPTVLALSSVAMDISNRKQEQSPTGRGTALTAYLSARLLVSLLIATTLVGTVSKILSPDLISAYLPAWLLVLGWMPLANALFDWISLGITRELLRRMPRSPAWMWGGMLLDVVAGLVLALGLLWLAFQMLYFMQWCGWPVDARTMRAAFVANPFDPQVSWLAMLAVTNLLPTIWHLGVSLWGLVDRQFTTSASLKDSLTKLNAFMDDQGNPKPGATAPGLGALELQTVYQSLYVHPWLYTGTVVAVVFGFWGSYVQALRWTLTWLP